MGNPMIPRLRGASAASARRPTTRPSLRSAWQARRPALLVRSRFGRCGFVDDTRLSRLVWYGGIFGELTQGEEVAKRSLKHHVDASFVTVDEVQVVGVGEGGEGRHEAVGGGGALLHGHGGVEIAVFDGPG